MSEQNGGNNKGRKFKRGENWLGLGFLDDDFGGSSNYGRNIDEAWAKMWNSFEGNIETKGVLVLRSKITPGRDDFRGAKLVTKRPIRSNWLEIPEKYELTLSMDMDGRELLDHKELAPGVYLLKFDGYFGPYFAIGLAPDWNPNYRRATLNFSHICVAVSDRMPVKSGEYQCTVIKKRDDGSTAVERATFLIAENVKPLGVNSALCDLKDDGRLLLVTWSSRSQKK